MSYLSPKQYQETVRHCVSHIRPLFQSVRESHSGRLPESVGADPYLLGYVEAMVDLLLDGKALPEGRPRGFAKLSVLSSVFEQEPEKVGRILANLHVSMEDSAYLEGIDHGQARLVGSSDGRREEVTYELIHRLESYQ